MTIKFGTGEPETGRALAAAGVDRVLGQGGGLDAVLRARGAGQASAGEDLRAARPHRSFTCRLAGAADDVVANASFAGWRYLVFRGEECVAAAEVKRRPEGQPAILSSVLYGEDFGEQLQELDWLAGRGEIEQADFELRFLQVHGLAVSAWWLSRGTDGQGDLFVPVPPSQQALRPQEHTLYEGAESFNQVVRKLAYQKQAAAEILLADLLAGLPGE